MTTIEVFDYNNTKIENLTLKSNILSSTIKPYLLTEIVNWQRAKKRNFCQSLLTKSEVKGSNKKPFAQKGRGHARQGSMKNPHQIGGGIAFAPKPRNYTYKIPKTKRKAALISALSLKAKEKNLKIISNFLIKDYTTHNINKIITNICTNNKALIVDINNNHLKNSIKNLQNVKYLHVNGINIYDILYFKYLLLTKNALLTIESKLFKKTI